MRSFLPGEFGRFLFATVGGMCLLLGTQVCDSNQQASTGVQAANANNKARCPNRQRVLMQNSARALRKSSLIGITCRKRIVNAFGR